MDDFFISYFQAKYDVMVDVGSQKANITMGQIIALNPAIKKNLREVLSFTRTKKQRCKENAHMTNMEVDVMDAVALEICTHVSRLK